MAVGFSINGKGYVAWGSDKAIITGEDDGDRTLWEFDPNFGTSGKWTEKSNFPEWSRNHAAVFVINGAAYLSGGFIIDFDYGSLGGTIEETWKYNPASDTWTKVTNAPIPLKNSAYFTSGNFGYVVGGYYTSNIYNGTLTKSNYVIRYDSNNNSWTQLTDYPGSNPGEDGMIAFSPCDNMTVVGNSESSKFYNLIDNNILNIYGSSVVCTTNSTFTLSNPPPGATITWEKSSNLSFVGSSTGTSVTVKATSSSTSESGWVRAKTSGNCGVFTLAEKTIWVGKPAQSGSSNLTVSPSYVDPGDDVYYSHSPTDIPGATSYSEQVTFPPTPQHFTFSSVDDLNGSIYVKTSAPASTYSFIIKAQNTCGYRSYSGSFQVEGSGGGGCGFFCFSVSPNPSGDFIDINAEENPEMQALSIETTTKTKANEDSKYQFALFDLQHNLVMKGKTKKFNARLDVRNINPGHYILHISDKGGTVKQHVLIE